MNAKQVCDPLGMGYVLVKKSLGETLCAGGYPVTEGIAVFGENPCCRCMIATEKPFSYL